MANISLREKARVVVEAALALHLHTWHGNFATKVKRLLRATGAESLRWAFTTLGFTGSDTHTAVADKLGFLGLPGGSIGGQTVNMLLESAEEEPILSRSGTPSPHPAGSRRKR